MAYELRKEDLSFLDTAPLQVREEATIAAAPAAVWPALADPAAWPRWFVGMKDAHATSDGPFGLGSTRAVQVATLKVNETILAFDEPERFGFRVDDSNVPALAAMVELITLEPSAGGADTIIVYRQAVELKPWARLFGSIMRRQLRDSVRASLVALPDWVAAHAGS